MQIRIVLLLITLKKHQKHQMPVKSLMQRINFLEIIIQCKHFLKSKFIYMYKKVNETIKDVRLLEIATINILKQDKIIKIFIIGNVF